MLQHQHHQDVELNNETVNSFQTGTLRHTFDFKSVYHQTNENYVSTYQDKWILVDYIFYADESKKISNAPELELMNYLSLPTEEQCEKLKLQIPNKFSGSDHLSIAAQFKLCYNEKQQMEYDNNLKSKTTTKL
jgi:hypothetical protein